MTVITLITHLDGLDVFVSLIFLVYITTTKSTVSHHLTGGPETHIIICLK